MEGSIKDLSKIRLERAEEMLASARKNYDENDYRTALNRSYYSIFHAMRSVNCLEGFDSSKHSGVIAFFNKEILKERRIDPSFSDIIKMASYCREKSDYDDFYIVSKKETEEQIENAEKFLAAVKAYLVEQINE